MLDTAPPKRGDTLQLPLMADLPGEASQQPLEQGSLFEKRDT
jgi:hypothetical protein